MTQTTLKTLVIASHNRKKAGEMITIIGTRFPDLELKTLADYEGAPEPEETGTSYEANSAIKVESAAAFTLEWCVADDAGLEIDFLHGAPGLYSRRFGGEDMPFPEKIAKILDMMRDVSPEERGARFRCFVALTGPDRETPVRFFSATCEGRIAESPSGAGGFGYDPIFYLPDQGCTMADLTAERKHQISHRGKVLAQLGDYLESLV